MSVDASKVGIASVERLPTAVIATKAGVTATLRQPAGVTATKAGTVAVLRLAINLRRRSLLLF